MNDPIVNCIIPDEWIQKAIAANLGSTDGPRGLRKRKTILISPKGGGDNWRKGKLKRNVYALLADCALVWIRPFGEGVIKTIQGRMERMLLQADIPFATAHVYVKSDEPNSRRRKINWGVVVEMRDACRAILLFKPDLIEERRAIRYNRDDPEY